MDPDDAGKGETIASGETVASVETVASSDTLGSPPLRASRSADYARLLEVDPQHYQIGDEIARGGMGRILRAQDRRLGRRVAIKELIRRDDDAERRFEREARITARLQHPSIVHLHEAGRWPSGEPFYAMKLVAGKPLDKRIAACKTLDERLALLPNVIAVVDALAYAHSEGVIHRDLKPANVLCGDFGETVVIDWGLAKDLASTGPDDLPIGPYREPAHPDGTVDGAVIGTPAYMPPEQADGDKVDARADVYALGAMLYHALAGVPPYEGKTTAELLAKVLAAPPQPLLEIDPEIPVDLIAIVEKSMARDREERFPTAKEVVDELKRFQMGQLVASHRYTAWELVRRWVDRHRGAVAVGAIAVATLAVIGIISLSEIVSQRDRADRAAAIAQTRADTGTVAKATALLDRDPHAALVALQELSSDAPEWQAARMIAADAESRGFGRAIPTAVPGAAVRRLALSPDGSRIAAAYDDGEVTVWNITGDLPVSRAPHAAPILSLGFTADGALIAIDGAGAITRREPAGSIDQTIRRLNATLTVAVVAPGARRIAVFQHIPFEPDRGRLIDLDGGERELGRYFAGAWSPDGRRLALYDRDHDQVARFDLATGMVGQPVDAGPLASFATDGDRVWVGTTVGDVHELAGGVETDLAAEHTGGPIYQLAVLPSRGILSASSHTVVHRTDRGRVVRHDEGLYAGDFALTLAAPTPAWVVKLAGHPSTIGAIAASSDGSVVASGDHDGTIRLWRLPRIKRHPRERAIRTVARGKIPIGKTSTAAILTEDRREVVLARRGPALEVHELTTDRVRRIDVTDYNAGIAPPRLVETLEIEQIGDQRVEELTASEGWAVTALVHSKDRRHVATVDDHKHAVVWDVAANRGRMLATEISQIAISSDGRRVATAGDKAVQIWDAATGSGTTVPVEIEASALAFSPDGATLAAAAPTGAILLVTGAKMRVLDGERDQLHALAFSPDGSLLAGGGEGWRIHVWGVAAGGSYDLVGHAGTVTLLAFGSGDRLFSASADGTVRVWDALGRNPLVLRGHAGLIQTLDVRSDGRMLVTASADRTARIWDLATGHSRALPTHEDAVVFASYTDDEHVVTVDHGGTITEFPDDLPADRLGLVAWLVAAIR